MKNRILISGLFVLGFLAPCLQVSTERQSPRLALNFIDAFAGPITNCDAIIQAANAAAPAKGTYAEPVLDHFHFQLYRFNKLETADVELVFCRLANVLGVDPNLAKLPQTITKTDPRGHVITVAVTVPTEAFATTAGYAAKAVVSQDGNVFLTLWWAGSGTSSKGYLIQGANPILPDGMTRLRYVQWDRSGQVQTIKVYATQFATSYLSSVSGSAATQTGGDHAGYGRASFDTSSNAISGQAVEIRVQNPGDTSFSCFKTMFAGTLGGTISAYRPANGTPDSVTDTNTDGTHMDGITGVIDATTTSHQGTLVPQPATLPQPLDYSCDDLDTASAAGKPFAANAVNFSADPSTVFPH